MSISLELPELLSESELAPEPESESEESDDSEDSDDSASITSLTLFAALTAGVCLWPGSGEVDRLELLSLEVDEAGAISRHFLLRSMSSKDSRGLAQMI